MRSTFKVLFYLKRQSVRRDGRTPIMCRITINGEIAQFSSKLSVDEKLWDIKLSRAMGRSVEAKYINCQIENMRHSLSSHYVHILDKNHYVNAVGLRDAYLGLNVQSETLLKLFKTHNDDFARQVGHDRAQSTYNKYCGVYRHLERFIKARYNRSDLMFRELDPKFIRDFDIYLRTQMDCSTNTIWVYMMPLKRMITMARHRGYISTNPFYEYRLTPEDKDRGYLSERELEVLMRSSFSSRKLTLTRDLFVFSCFTGLSYSDMCNLREENIKQSFDGHLWIVARRQKTNIPINVRLLEIPRKILERYRNIQSNGHIFAVPSNCRCNSNLKEIAALLNIKMHLTFHVARHTFATTITLSHGVPIETVSRLLGHTNIKTTQIYARITNSKLSRDMELLSNELESMKNMMNI